MVARALLAALLLALAGCGGSGRLSHDDLVARADALCQQADREVAGLGQPVTTADIARLGPRVTALQRRFLDRVARLKPPRADAARFARLLVSYRRTAQLTRQLVSAARAGRQDRLVGLAAQLQLENARGDRL